MTRANVRCSRLRERTPIDAARPAAANTTLKGAIHSNIDSEKNQRNPMTQATDVVQLKHTLHAVRTRRRRRKLAPWINAATKAGASLNGGCVIEIVRGMQRSTGLIFHIDPQIDDQLPPDSVHMACDHEG